LISTYPIVMLFPSYTHLVVVCIVLGFCIQHVKADVICGGLGSYNISVTTFYMGNFFFKAPSTFALCGDFCKNDDRCRSFRYSWYADPDSQYCEFFDLYA
jgi:hypothetical protein